MDRYEMPRGMLIDLLQRHGWLGEDHPTDHDIDVAVRSYQQWHGLNVDGWAGKVTERSLSARRFCALPDINRAGANLCKWGKREITWAFASGFALNSITREQAQRCFQDAFDRWSSVCNITATYASSGQAPDIVITSGRIDGPSGTLAWSELPCGADRQLQQKYDDREQYVIAINPSQSQIGLPHVACHEIGHALGLDHINAAGNLMNPIYNSRIHAPQREDTQQGVARYGPPAAAPEPEPPTPDEPESPGGLDPECRKIVVELVRELFAFARDWMNNPSQKPAGQELVAAVREARETMK